MGLPPFKRPYSREEIWQPGGPEWVHGFAPHFYKCLAIFASP